MQICNDKNKLSTSKNVSKYSHNLCYCKISFIVLAPKLCQNSKLKSTYLYLIPSTCLLKPVYFNILWIVFEANQCDQVVRLFFNIVSSGTLKICPAMSQFCQNRLSICEIRNKLTKFWQKLVNFRQSGEISPNLVTLKLTCLASLR